MGISWDEVIAHALSLPDTVEDSLYAGWPAVLVRFATNDPEHVRAMIGQAHDQAAARKPSRPRKKT